jgi:hypothetical protein
VWRCAKGDLDISNPLVRWDDMEAPGGAAGVITTPTGWQEHRDGTARTLPTAGTATLAHASNVTSAQNRHEDNMLRRTHSAGRVRTEGVPADSSDAKRRVFLTGNPPYSFPSYSPPGE